MLKRTPLYDEEIRVGAKFTEYAGWELPVYYSSIIGEHMAVRSSAGLFDISHLGKIGVVGQGSAELLQHLATIDIKKISVGRGAYTIFCNETGGIIDDDIVYRFDETDYMVIANASRVHALIDWLERHKSPKTEIGDRTDELCLLALQGPDAPKVLKLVFNDDPGLYKRYSARVVEVGGKRFSIVRSGYTGEEGYEIIAEPKAAEQIWRVLLGEGIRPAGLGARDTLRLEMGYPLYSRDISTETTPLEAGLKWIISFEKRDFIGKEALLKQAERGVERKLVGLVLEKGIARGKERLFSVEGKEIGYVTSGGYSPVLKRGICMAYVRHGYEKVGTQIKVEARGKQLMGRIESRPFIRK